MLWWPVWAIQASIRLAFNGNLSITKELPSGQRLSFTITQTDLIKMICLNNYTATNLKLHFREVQTQEKLWAIWHLKVITKTTGGKLNGWEAYHSETVSTATMKLFNISHAHSVGELFLNQPLDWRWGLNSTGCCVIAQSSHITFCEKKTSSSIRQTVPTGFQSQVMRGWSSECSACRNDNSKHPCKCTSWDIVCQ